MPSSPSLPYTSKISDRTAVTYRLDLSSSPDPAATPGFDALTVQRSACGQRRETSIHSCCGTSKEPGNNVHNRAPGHGLIGSRLHPVMQLRDLPFQVRVTCSLEINPFNVHRTGRLGTACREGGKARESARRRTGERQRPPCSYVTT